MTGVCVLGCGCCDWDDTAVKINDKVFAKADENLAANGFLKYVQSTVEKIRSKIAGEDIFAKLTRDFNEGKLPEPNGGDKTNQKRLGIANEAILVGELLTTIQKAYDNYSAYFDKNYNDDYKNSFNNVFFKFLGIVEKMIMNTLSNYIITKYNETVEDKLNEDNSFLLKNIDINSFLGIYNTIQLRDAVGQLFTLTFGGIALKELNSKNEDINLTPNDILKLDCMTLKF